jgi:hypothetical protein
MPHLQQTVDALDGVVALAVGVFAIVARRARLTRASSSLGSARICMRAAAVGLLCIAAAYPDRAAVGATFTCHSNGAVSDHKIKDCTGRQTITTPAGVTTDLPANRSPKEQLDFDSCTQKRTEVDHQNSVTMKEANELALRYPNDAAHDRARETALRDVRAAFRRAVAKREQLALERKPLNDEAEFYKGAQMPQKLRSAIDANDAAVAALNDIQRKLDDDLAQINSRFDDEHNRLVKLRAGARPSPVPVPNCSKL